MHRYKDIQVSTFAGCGKPAFRDGKAGESMFHNPSGISISNDAKVYLIDYGNFLIRMISGGLVSTFAGCGGQGYVNGKVENAMFKSPNKICVSDDDTMYILDSQNYCIRMISDGMVSTIAGCGKEGYLDGKAEDAMFRTACGICISPEGDLYITDTDNNCIRMISDGIVSTIVGSGKVGFQDGKAENAMFNGPSGICISDDGKIYIADTNNNRIRMISDGMVTTIAGSGQDDFQDGKAENAKFSGPMGICLSNDNKIYLTDFCNHRIRMMSDRRISTIAGCTNEGYLDGKAEDAMFSWPYDLCVSEFGEIFVTDGGNNCVRMISGLSYASPAYFELSLLLDSKSLSDMTLTINNHQYHLHTIVIQLSCPKLIECKSMIENAKISNESLEMFFKVIYSNNGKQMRKRQSQYQISDLTRLIELTWLFESFEIKNQLFASICVEQFKTRFKYAMKHETYKSAIEVLNVDFLERIHHLSVLSGLEGLKTTKLEEIANTIDQNRKSPQNEQHETVTRSHVKKSESMSIHDIFTVLGLNTEPRVVDQQEIQSEIVLQYLETTGTNMALITQPDFTMVTHDRSYKIKCHKVILYGKWSYFRRMIESGLVESSSGEMIMPEDWNATRLYDFVRYLYTCKVGFDSLEDSVWLCENAEMYQLIEVSRNNQKSKISNREHYRLIEKCRTRAVDVLEQENRM